MQQKSKILIVCHDAGGAELVSAYVKKNTSRFSFVCYADGPALSVFKRKKIKVQLLNADAKKIGQVLKKHADARMVLLGSSGSAALEREFSIAARAVGLKTAVWLDHWVNYRERFNYPASDWKRYLPDELWVSDDKALGLARKLLPRPIKKMPNFYFKEMKDIYAAARRKNRAQARADILFISEPLSSALNVSDLRYDEYDILKALLTAAGKQDKKIIIRFHPAEDQSKYNQLLAASGVKYSLSNPKIRPLPVDLARSERVVGITSMALLVAANCRKKVISFYPYPKKKFPLPVLTLKLAKNFTELSRYAVS